MCFHLRQYENCLTSMCEFSETKKKEFSNTICRAFHHFSFASDKKRRKRGYKFNDAFKQNVWLEKYPEPVIFRLFSSQTLSRINTSTISQNLVILHSHLPTKMGQCFPKRRHIKFRRRGITQKKAYNIHNTA